MKFNSFFALCFVGLAAALPAADTDKVTTDIVVSTIPPSDLVVPKFAVPPGAAIVTQNSPFRALNPSLADSVVICPATGCAGTCFTFSLAALSQKICYSPSTAFYAAFLYIGSGKSYSFSAYASTTTATNCGNAYRLPINFCGSLPEDGFQFFLY